MTWVATGRLLEAVHDEEAFADVVWELAKRLGARSFFGGFGMEEGLSGVTVDSGWWESEQIDLYSSRFLAHDPCVAAMLDNWRPQQVLDLERLIGPRNFEHSRLYQGFIRPMGDDTFRSLAVPLEIEGSKGAVTFQRGNSQTSFNEEEKLLLARFAPELGQLFAARLKFVSLRDSEASSRELANAVARPMLVVRDDGTLVQLNTAAEALLRSGDPLELSERKVRPALADARRAFATLLASLHLRAPGLHGIRLQKTEGPADDATAMPLPEGKILLVISHAEVPGRADLLQAIYGLSMAESDVALRLEAGESLAEIAEHRHTSLHTVRQQVRHISQKLECSRQVDIVRRIAALPRIAFPDP